MIISAKNFSNSFQKLAVSNINMPLTFLPNNQTPRSPNAEFSKFNSYNLLADYYRNTVITGVK